MLSSGSVSVRLFLGIAVAALLLFSVPVVVYDIGPLKLPRLLRQQIKQFGSERFKPIAFESLVKNASMATSRTPSPAPYPGCEDSAMGLFDRIFVVSLPRRKDRREDMERVRRALALKWRYLDATSSDKPVIRITLDQVRNLREDPGLEDSFDWPAERHSSIAHSSQPQGSGLQTFPISLPSLTSSSESHAVTESSLWLVPTISPGRDQTGIDDSGSGLSTLEPLTCSTRNFTRGPLYAASLPSYMLLTPAKVACWYSHLQLLRKITADVRASPNCSDSVLVLEDDVDMERDVKQRLHGLWPALPANWDILFLGHCWSNETRYPALATVSLASSSLQTSLHPSYSPKCTHAYALSRSGASKLLNYLRHPPFAYSRALDQAMSWLVLSGKLRGFSVVPSVVVQRKVGRSDVDEGREGFGSSWRDVLADGVLDT